MEYLFETIEEVEEYLYSIPKFGSAGRAAANFSLDRMYRFCRRMGNPQDDIPEIHVAGTNGKGTTCQMLASVYEQAGYKTGLYTSPHLMDLRERFRINSQNIEDSDLLKFFQLFGKYAVQEKLTFFELTTSIAFWYFSNKNVDLAVIETGLGGRLDATNVITPELSVITSIGIDHADILGDSLKEIAVEKAGIIKECRPVVIGRIPEEGFMEINRISKERNSELYSAESLQPRFENGKIVLYENEFPIEIDAHGRKQVDAINASVARLVVNFLQPDFPVTDREFITGIHLSDQRYDIHAHFERLIPGRDWFFDGAHNTEAVKELTRELKSIAPVEQWTVILSFMEDKLNCLVSELWDQFPHIWVYRQPGERAANIERMKEMLPEAQILNDDNAIRLLQDDELKTELVIFSGSFYFYSTVRRWMGTAALKKK